MWLSEIEAHQLRNLRAVGVGLAAGLTVVVGRNGQGKTSLLEAAYLLGTGRSFRTRRQDDLVCWDGGPLRVYGTVQDLRGQARVGVVVDGSERRLLLDRSEIELERFIGRLDVVDLTGQRMEVLRGAPAERRRFLDRGVVGLQPSFLRVIGEYRRIVHQRNALLRSGRAGGAEIEAWNAKLIDGAWELHRARREYATRLGGALGEASRVLFGEGRPLTLRYRPSPASAGELDPGEFPMAYAAALDRESERDRTLGYTSVGPHRDEIVIELDGVDLRRFGSSGQLRGAMIALKLGKLSLLQRERGETPLFLMDDFDTDIDERRAADLARHLERGGFQALVATSKEGMVERLGVSFLTIRMEGGEARAA